MSISINDRFLSAPDGTRIAYRVEGTGPALVLTNGLTTTTTFWKYVRPIWLQKHTIVTWDLPGHGNSGPARSDDSARMQAQPRFIADVMRAAAVPRAAQVGWSTGAQVVLEMYRQYPELCSSVMMVLGGAGHSLENTRLPVHGATIEWLMKHLPRRAFRATHQLLAASFQRPAALGVGRRLGLIGSRVSTQDMRELTEHIARVDPPTLQRLTHSCQAHSAQDVLGTLRVPLLIVAGDRDPFAPTELVGLPLHRAAPGSKLLRLPDGTHTALLEEPVLIARSVEDFLAGRARGADARS